MTDDPLQRVVCVQQTGTMPAPRDRGTGRCSMDGDQASLVSYSL